VKGMGRALKAGVASVVCMTMLLPVYGGRRDARADSPPRVVLTFDDGYNFDHRILDYLNSQGIIADAFVVGAWAQNNPSLLREMNGLGWEICNHTQNHPWLTKIPDQQIQAELNACQSVISSITGQHQPFFRPTWGAMDNRVQAVVTSMGYIPVLWDFDSMDSAGTNVAPVQVRVANIVGSARDGSKILFHFGGRNTYELLTGVVQGLQKRGFTFVTLGELYGMREEAKGGESGPGLAETTTRCYFAEGNTRPGFEEWLLILNPGGVAAKVQATFFSPQGKLEKTFLVPPRARQSISLNAEVPWRDDLSTVLESSVPVAAERMIYFNRGKGFNGGLLSPGTIGPSTRYLFAEGSTRPGFEEWLILFNPSSTSEAQAVVEFYGEAGKVKETELAVAPLTRVTARVNDLVEGGGDISIILRSSIPVVAERSQYFLYDNRIAGAHSAPGVSAPYNQCYFAEGTTRSFFENYLILFNPCAYSTWIKVRLTGSDGQAWEEMVDLAAGARKTLHLNEYMPADIDFSIHVSSLLPVVAERSAYFQSHNVAGGYCTRGTPQAQTYLLFPEGCTAPGYQEWLALFNPSNRTQEVRVEYLRAEGEAESRSYVLPPEGRLTVDVAAEVGQQDEVSIELEAPGGVVAERSIYFSRPIPK
jgi:peptidoglycan/xylan/chitin deacetylase (PgdA/CDA1 family)